MKSYAFDLRAHAIKAFFLFVFLISLGSEAAVASPPIMEAGNVDGKQNERTFLAAILPLLKSEGLSGRVNYRATCEPQSKSTLFFPPLNLQDPPKNVFGVNALRTVFRSDKNVFVSERKTGIILITIGDVPDAVLTTKIPALNLMPFQQYNEGLAIISIENTYEVRATMRSLGLSLPFTPFNQLLVSPAKGLPHLPTSMMNKTVDQTLDVIAGTFGGIVLYGACPESGLFDIGYAGGFYFDYSTLSGKTLAH